MIIDLILVAAGMAGMMGLQMLRRKLMPAGEVVILSNGGPDPTYGFVLAGKDRKSQARNVGSFASPEQARAAASQMLKVARGSRVMAE